MNLMAKLNAKYTEENIERALANRQAEDFRLNHLSKNNISKPKTDFSRSKKNLSYNFVEEEDKEENLIVKVKKPAVSPRVHILPSMTPIESEKNNELITPKTFAPKNDVIDMEEIFGKFDNCESEFKEVKINHIDRRSEQKSNVIAESILQPQN